MFECLYTYSMSNISVHCKAGKFIGTVSGNINFFYGIPYAKPLNQEHSGRRQKKLILKYPLKPLARVLVHPKQFMELHF